MLLKMSSSRLCFTLTLISLGIFSGNAYESFTPNLNRGNNEERNSKERLCASPSGSLDGRILVEEGAGGGGAGSLQRDFTTLRWQIGLGETLCYRFLEKDTPQHAGYVEVSYNSLKAVYSMTDSYAFMLPETKVECLCDCPGGGSYCDSGVNSCGNKTHCVNYYNPSVQSKGCFFNFLHLSSTLCCSIQVQPATKEKFRAVHLGVPSILAQFTTRYKSAEGQLLKERKYMVDLNTGTTVDWDVSLQVSTSGPTNMVPMGWYVVKGQNTLIAGVEVNSLNGWDLDKFGWLKTDPEGHPVTSKLSQLLHRFTPKVESCANQRYSGKITGGKVNLAGGLGGYILTEKHPFVSRLSVYERHVEMYYRDSPLLSLTLQHKTAVDLVMRYHGSQVKDFTGLLYQDKASHLHLNLTLFEASGTLSGSVIGIEEIPQTILIRLPIKVSNSSHQIKLGAMECLSGQVTVKVRPLSLKKLTLTKQLPCVMEGMRRFTNSDKHLSEGLPWHQQGISIVAGSASDCLSCGAAWLQWLDPEHWMEAGWSSTRAVIAFCMVLSILMFLFMLTKVIRCFCCRANYKK